MAVCYIRVLGYVFVGQASLTTSYCCRRNPSPIVRRCQQENPPFFPLLGLQLATDRRKAVAWSTRVKTLDVLIDLEPEGGDGHREVAWRAKSGNKAHRTL